MVVGIAKNGVGIAKRGVGIANNVVGTAKNDVGMGYKLFVVALPVNGFL